MYMPYEEWAYLQNEPIPYVACHDCTFDYPQRCECGGTVHEQLDHTCTDPDDCFPCSIGEWDDNFDEAEDDKGNFVVRRCYRIYCDRCSKIYC